MSSQSGLWIFDSYIPFCSSIKEILFFFVEDALTCKSGRSVDIRVTLFKRENVNLHMNIVKSSDANE